MSRVLQFSKSLADRPQPAPPDWLALRTFQGRDDIPIWLELRRRAFALMKVGVRDWDQEDFRREFLAKPWWKREHLWFAETTPSAGATRPRTAIGTVTLALRGSGPQAQPVVHWLAVHPAWRRRGVGRLLMAALEACVWDAGGRTLALETHEDWRAAIEFYGALGYATDQPVGAAAAGAIEHS
jgi:GNAT superfamily N-acetyltransferase